MNPLLKQVTGALFQAHPTSYHQFIATAPVFDETTVKQQLNRYWRTQIASLDEDTRDVRLCLDDNLSDEDWLYAFKTHVIPFLVSRGLPR